MAINKNKNNNNNAKSVQTNAKNKPRNKKAMKNSFKEPTTSMLYLIPFIATIIIIPLIVRYHSFENHLSTETWHKTEVMSHELFLYYKSVWFIGFSVLLLFLLVSALLIKSKKIRFEAEYIPLAIYFVFVVLSTIFSVNIYFSLHGIEGHFESVWVLIGYVIILLYGSIMADNTKAVKVIMWGLFAGTFILTVLGVFQAFKLDFFLSDWIKIFMMPSDMQDTKMKLNFPLGQVYITLYNPNYVGYFSAITIPIFLTLAFSVKAIWQKILFGITVIGIFICAIASGAKNGLMAVIGSLIFLIIMFRRQLFKFWYIIVAGIAILAIVFLGVNKITDNRMTGSLKYAFDTLFKEDPVKRHLNSLECEDDGAVFNYDGKDFTITMDVSDSGGVTVNMYEGKGSSKKEIDVKLNESNYFISQSKEFPATVLPLSLGLTSSSDNNTVICIDVIIDGYDYILSNQLAQYGYDDSYYYRNVTWKWVKPIKAEAVIFDKKPKLFSNRGYIWSKTIPLLKDTIFVGSGPDTFALVFPHDDYVDKAYVGFLNQIITKPHSLYLQIAEQTGVISVLAFIALFLIYFIKSIMLYWKHPLDTVNSRLGIGITAAVFGYMISGIINDSTVSYSPVFWAVLGVGIALNRLVKNEYEGRPDYARNTTSGKKQKEDKVSEN